MHFTHTYSVFLCPLVLVPFPPFPSGHWHVVTVVRIIGDVLGSDERLLEVHAELSRAELAAFSADYTSSRLQERYCERVQHGLHKQQVTRALLQARVQGTHNGGCLASLIRRCELLI